MDKERKKILARHALEQRTFEQHCARQLEMIKQNQELKMRSVQARQVKLTSEIDELNYWLTANGNKPVISQEESVEKAGLSNNVELTMQKLKDQATTENSFIIGEPQLEMDA